MEVNFEYRPLPVHTPFHTSTARERAAAGAFGSGKSYASVAEAIAWCLEQPGIEGAIVRKTVPELKRATEPVFKKLLPAELWKSGKASRSGGHLESFLFPNGSLLWFLSMDDWNKHRSLNLGFIAYDEMNEIDEESYLGMLSRVRQRDITAEARNAGYTHEITRRGIWGAFNPSGHDWIWRRFHPDSPTREKNTEMFTSTTLDNPYLTPEYVESLLGYPKPWIQRYVLCSFDDFAGSIYDEWSYDTHVIPDVKPEAGRVFWMGLDPGTRAPTAGLWVWVDQEQRRLVGIADYEEPGLAVTEHAAAWKRIEAQHRMSVRWRVADPNSITQRDRGTALSLQTQYAQQGFQFGLGASSDKDRIPALGQLINLRRFVVTQSCARTFEAIKQYQWKDLTPAERSRGEDPKETPLKKDTHLVECAQYLAGRQMKTPKLQVPLHPDEFQDEIWRAVKKQNRRSRTRRPSHDLGGLNV